MFKYSDVAIAGQRTLYNADAVLQSLKTAILTKAGERIFEPDTGSRLDTYLFGYVEDSKALDIKTEIKRVLAQDDRAKLEALEVIPDEVNNRYEVRVTISLDGDLATDTLTLKPRGV